MKVMVATKEGQGIRDNDFSWTEEGELVGFVMECDGEEIDGECGCRRSMSGFDSHKATTTFKVVDRDMTKEEFINKYLESKQKAGWFDGEANKEQWIKSAEELLDIAEGFSINKILEKRGNKIQTRIV